MALLLGSNKVPGQIKKDGGSNSAHGPCVCHLCSTKILLDLISEFAKQWEYKVTIQKSKAFLYTNNEISETEVRKITSFPIATKKIKYLGINLTKEVKDLYSENYVILKKEIKENTNKWKHVPWTRRINMIKMSILPKQFIDSMQSLLKNL